MYLLQCSSPQKVHCIWKELWRLRQTWYDHSRLISVKYVHTTPHVIYSGSSAFQVKHLSSDSCGPHQRYVLETTRRCLCQHTPTLAVDCTFFAEKGREREREREKERERGREWETDFPFLPGMCWASQGSPSSLWPVLPRQLCLPEDVCNGIAGSLLSWPYCTLSHWWILCPQL